MRLAYCFLGYTSWDFLGPVLTKNCVYRHKIDWECSQATSYKMKRQICDFCEEVVNGDIGICS